MYHKVTIMLEVWNQKILLKCSLTQLLFHLDLQTRPTLQVNHTELMWNLVPTRIRLVINHQMVIISILTMNTTTLDIRGNHNLQLTITNNMGMGQIGTTTESQIMANLNIMEEQKTIKTNIICIKHLLNRATIKNHIQSQKIELNLLITSKSNPILLGLQLKVL
jgi:hypothetical protein